MKRTYSILFLLASGCALQAADPLPSGEAILDKYIEVTGGKAAYEKVQNQVSSVVMEFVGKGVKANVTIYHAAPVKSYSVINIEGIGRMEEGTDGTVVWDRSDLKGPRIKKGEERAVSLRGAALGKDVRWRDYFTKVECTGIEPIDGHVAYRVVLTPKVGQPETRYYDKTSSLLVRTNMIMKTEMGEIPAESMVSDYRKVDGVLIPFQVKQKVLGQELALTVQSIKNNVEIPPDRFALPDDVKALAESAPK
jgi:hypothetical protein